MDDLCKSVGQWQNLRRVAINDFRKPDFVQHANRWSLACHKYLTKPPPAGHAFVAETAQHLLSDIPAQFKTASSDLTYALKDMVEPRPAAPPSPSLNRALRRQPQSASIIVAMAMMD